MTAESNRTATFGSYRLVELLAAGGMGEVYIGEHLLLGRKAAIKVLLPRVSEIPSIVQRFFQEAKATAAIGHPGIVDIYDFGYNDEGRAYLVMEYLQGESLKSRLKRIPILPMALTLHLIGHVCDALGAAHDRGIVHRDLKPDNIMLVRDPAVQFGERPKILDFGIAKLKDEEISTVRTSTGMLMGTPAYMSPEQCRGAGDVDHRADYYSLGCILYEMICGRRPFVGATAGELIGMHQFKAPARPSEFVSDMNPQLESLVIRLLAKNPKDRLQNLRELQEELAHLKLEFDDEFPIDLDFEDAGYEDDVTDVDMPTASLLQPTMTRIPAQETLDKLMNTPVTVAHPNIRQPHTNPTPSASRGSWRVPSIAVLPFHNRSSDPEQQYFCDGIAEDIINDLSRLDGIRVAARSSSFAFRNRDQDAREVGKALGVESLLEGSVRRAGNRLRINVELVQVSDGYQIWSARYDQEVKDVFDIQDEIARSIVDTLKIELSREELSVLNELPATSDPEAYDYYLRGLRFFYQSSRNSMVFAREMFELAIGRDPGYALAHAGIANCAAWIYMYFDHTSAHLDQALEASLQAVSLAPRLAEAHVARGLAISLQERYAEAESEFEIAINLNPKLSAAYLFYARTCFVQGKLEASVDWFERAHQSDPSNYQALFILGRVYRRLQKVAEYKLVLRQGLQMAEKHLRFNPDDVRAIYLSAQGFAELGDPVKGLEWAQRALAIDPEDPVIVINMCAFLAIVGEHDAAIPYLDKALKNGFSQLQWLEHDSYFDPIRDRDDYKATIEKWRRLKYLPRYDNDHKSGVAE